MKKMTFILILMAQIICSGLFGQTQISGVITDKHSGELILFASVAVYSDGQLVAGTETDFDGQYIFSDIAPGSYSLEVSYIGFAKKVRPLVLTRSAAVEMEVNLAMEESNLCWGGCGYFLPPMIEFDALSQGHTILLGNNGTISKSNAFVKD